MTISQHAARRGDIGALTCVTGFPATRPAAGLPSLTLGLALALFAGVIWAVDRLLTRLAPAAIPGAGCLGARARPPMSPRLAACCEIAMGVTMSYMLITMLSPAGSGSRGHGPPGVGP